MKFLQTLIVVGAVALLSPWLNAADAPETVIKRELEGSRPDVKVQSVAPSEIPGLYAVQFINGPQVYATPDGKFFVLGDLFQVQANGFVNLAETRRDGERAKLLATVKPEDMVIFKAKGKTKSVVSVFTDIDCGYCRKLHKEVPALNAMGIEVRYLAYPRAGIGSDSYQKLVTVWCAKDRQGTLTRYKNGENVPVSSCKNNPVSMEYELGDKMGVNGTPALIKPDGELIPGYMPAAELAQALGLK
ncbi:MAG: DsbC family protein [Spongiibacteraceae bacterium]